MLSVLNEADCYGYEIAKTVRVKSDNSFKLKEGTMYLGLKRLEKQGLIESYWGDESSAGGRRKYYKVTPTGKNTLE